MIRNSFIFLPKVGEKKEQSIWSAGIHSWNDFLSSKVVSGVSQKYKGHHDRQLLHAMDHLKEENSHHFSTLLPPSQQWRLWNEFKDDAVFLDIETTGYHGSITVVGLYDGRDTKMMVRHINLDKELLAQELKKYKLLVTFNGRSFDMPVIKKYFGIETSIPHIDLRHVCSRIGLTGGLKKIEKEIGIARQDEVKDVDGMEAVRLYHKWRKTGEKKHLDLLLMYNEEDIINLKTLANYAIPRLWQKTFATHLNTNYTQ